MTLGDYLEAAGHQRRKEGTHDCATFPAGWAMLCGHPDPMAKWRGTYASDEEAEHVIAEAARRGEGLGRGGLEMLFAEGMWDAGVPEIYDGQPGPDFALGDIAVVNLAGNEAGAIFAGKRWAFVPDRGIGFVTLPPCAIVRAWRPQHHG